MNERFAIEREGPVAAQHQRGLPRESVFLATHASGEAAGREATLRIRNISAGGLMADGKHPFAKDDRLSVDLRGVGLVHGHIAWASAERIGMAFDEPIDPQRVRKPVSTLAAPHLDRPIKPLLG